MLYEVITSVLRPLSGKCGDVAVRIDFTDGVGAGVRYIHIPCSIHGDSRGIIKGSQRAGTVDRAGDPVSGQRRYIGLRIDFTYFIVEPVGYKNIVMGINGA